MKISLRIFLQNTHICDKLLSFRCCTEIGS